MAEKTIVTEAVGLVRGRTFSDTYVLVDEAQNLSRKQILMMLTRLGPGSKMIVSGDLTQCDLAEESGLVYFRKVAENLAKKGKIGIVEFTNSEIVRHPLIADIINECEQLDAQKPVSRSRPPSPRQPG